jgi:N-acyl-D-amino-acid deacylase
MIDEIIERATIYDGADPKPFVTDLAIVGDRVALLGDLSGRDAYARSDGRGLALTPGFIDTHSHSDELWLADGRCESKILQGVTTEIAGNCGTSVAPLRGAAETRKAEEARAVGVELAWRDFDEFFDIVERSGTALNVASLVGLGTTRRAVRGDLEGRLEDDELAAECALVRESVARGALGVSSGLIYVPSRYADERELIACASAAREAGMPRYASHLRSEGDDLLQAVDEALTVAREAGVAVQFSHHKAAGKRNWGKVHRSLDAIAAAQARGIVANADVYPYVAMWTGLDTILPEDALLGGREATLARLREPETAVALALRLQLERAEEWHDIAISSVGSEKNAWVAGLRLDDLATHWRLSPPRAALRLLSEENLDVSAIFFAMTEADVATVISAGFVSIGSDASARATTGPTAQGLPHPRTFGTFPRVFGRYVRGRRTLEIGEAVRRMTSLAADQFGLAGRGRIAPGLFADLVLFNADTIVDTATYDRPYSPPRGIEAVWVNGKAVVRGGIATGQRPGRALRGGRAT